MNIRLVLAFALFMASIFYDTLERQFIVPENSVDYNKILDLQEPSGDVVLKSSKINSIIQGPSALEDKIYLSVLHNEMGKAVEKYAGYNTLQFENFYYDTTSEFLGKRMSGKYPDLGNFMYDTIVGTLGEDEGVISQDESKKLVETMRGLAWVMMNSK